METILVLTGVTLREDIDRFPYRPMRIVESVNTIELWWTSNIIWNQETQVVKKILVSFVSGLPVLA